MYYNNILKVIAPKRERIESATVNPLKTYLHEESVHPCRRLRSVSY